MANLKLWSGNIYVWFDLIWYSWLGKQTCQLSLTHSIRATENHAQSWKSHAFFIKNSLKIAKFIKEHLKVYMQEYNYVLKQQWLFLKYHNALLVSKHPIKYFKKPMVNHAHCPSMWCFINIMEKCQWSILITNVFEYIVGCIGLVCFGKK